MWRLRVILISILCIFFFSLCLPLLSLFLSPTCSQAEVLTWVTSESPVALSVRKVPVSPGGLGWSLILLVGCWLVGWFNLLRWFCCVLRKVPNSKSCWWTECCTESRDCPKGLSVHCTQLIMIINIKRLEPVLMGGELPSKGSWCLGEGQMLDSEEGSRPDHERFSPNA